MDREATFVYVLLPVIQNWVRKLVPARRGEDFIEETFAEAAAIGWKRFLLDQKHGKQPAEDYPAAFARWVVLAALNGRRLAYSRGGKDLQRKPPGVYGRPGTVSLGALVDKGEDFPNCEEHQGRDSVYHVVQCKLDFQKWQNTLSRLHGKILAAILMGETTKEIAHSLERTSGAVSHHRKKLRESYESFVNG